MMARACSSTIAKFYEGKSVFITGGTGFIGKVLIEKLIYRCSDIDKVYVLIRNTAQQNEKQRLKVLLQNPAFTRLRAEKPQALAKIVPIAGDLTLPNLGIKPQDEETLLEKVAVVFNVAASIDLAEDLRESFTLNVEGTDKVLDLGRRMKRLEGFIHFSTTFCYENKRQVLEEKVYPPPVSREDVYKFLENNKKHSKKAIEQFLSGFPITYTFTKALGEALVVEKRGTMPTVILRPSIVMPSLVEPMEGFVDNWQGSTIMLMAGATGKLRTMLGVGDYITDPIPVDYVANMAVIAATKCTSDVAVYNCCTSSVNPLTCRNFFAYFSDETVGSNEKPRSSVTFFKNASMVEAYAFFTQTVPAYCLDLWRVIRNKKPKYVKQLAMLTTLRKACQPVVVRSCNFRSERAQALLRSLSPADRRLFPCHPADIHWQPYLAACFRGVQRFLMKKEN